MAFFSCFFSKGHGMSYTVAEFQELNDKLPEIMALCGRLDQKPNVYYEGVNYRVFFDPKTQTFVNLDLMVRFSPQQDPPEDCQEV